MLRCNAWLTCYVLSALWVSHCKLSLCSQCIAASERASSCRKPHTFWFIYVLMLQLVHRSTSVLSSSEAGMGFLSAWQDETTSLVHKTDGYVQKEWQKSIQEASQGATESIQLAGPSMLSQGVLSMQSGLQSAAVNQSNQNVWLAKTSIRPSQAEDAVIIEQQAPLLPLSSREAGTNTNLIDSFPRTTAQSVSGAGRKKKICIWYAKNNRRGR